MNAGSWKLKNIPPGKKRSLGTFSRSLNVATISWVKACPPMSLWSRLMKPEEKQAFYKWLNHKVLITCSSINCTFPAAYPLLAMTILKLLHLSNAPRASHQPAHTTSIGAHIVHAVHSGIFWVLSKFNFGSVWPCWKITFCLKWAFAYSTLQVSSAACSHGKRLMHTQRMQQHFVIKIVACNLCIMHKQLSCSALQISIPGINVETVEEFLTKTNIPKKKKKKKNSKENGWSLETSRKSVCWWWWDEKNTGFQHQRCWKQLFRSVDQITLKALFQRRKK